MGNEELKRQMQAYLEEKLLDAIYDFEDENQVNILVQQFPEYDSDYCIEEALPEYQNILETYVEKIVGEYLIPQLFYYEDEF